MLLTVDPLERRDEGVEDAEEAPEAPAMLWVEGEAGGSRWDKELEGERVGENQEWLVFIRTNLTSEGKNYTGITYSLHYINMHFI